MAYQSSDINIISSTNNDDKMNGDPFTVATNDYGNGDTKKQYNPNLTYHPVFTCFKIRTMDIITKVLAEVIGTAMLLFLGCMGGLTWEREPETFVGGLMFGLTVMLIIQCFGNISGAHLNPAVTVCAILYRTTSVSLGILYMIAQMLGAIIGFGGLVLLTPTNILRPEGKIGAGYCSTVPQKDITEAQGVIIEFLATTVLILLCCASWDPRNENRQDSLPIKFGLAVAALSITVGPYTGCSMNPARTLGPAVFNNDWDMHWIYWVGPMASSVITTLIYQGLFVDINAPPPPPIKFY